jgi:hypothetical protein
MTDTYTSTLFLSVSSQHQCKIDKKAQGKNWSTFFLSFPIFNLLSVKMHFNAWSCCNAWQLALGGRVETNPPPRLNDGWQIISLRHSFYMSHHNQCKIDKKSQGENWSTFFLSFPISNLLSVKMHFNTCSSCNAWQLALGGRVGKTPPTRLNDGWQILSLRHSFYMSRHSISARLIKSPNAIIDQLFSCHFPSPICSL